MSEHGQEIDPVTGHETTGHEWNGIKELNTPFPRIALWALIISVAYSVIAWVLLPAWPTGKSFTPGILGVTETSQAEAELAHLDALRSGWRDQFAAGDFDALQADAALMALARPEAMRLFADNCAACHGAEGQGHNGKGGIGFPALSDPVKLWSSDPADIAEVIRVGINSANDESNVSEMSAFGRDEMLEPAEIDELVPYVIALADGTADPGSPAATLFEDNCASCHGEGGEGGVGVGAPALAHHSWIYGGEPAQIRKSIWYGRKGEMPAWDGRLNASERNMLALYVLELTEKAAAQ